MVLLVVLTGPFSMILLLLATMLVLLVVIPLLVILSFPRLVIFAFVMMMMVVVVVLLQCQNPVPISQFGRLFQCKFTQEDPEIVVPLADICLRFLFQKSFQIVTKRVSELYEILCLIGLVLRFLRLLQLLHVLVDRHAQLHAFCESLIGLVTCY